MWHSVSEILLTGWLLFAALFTGGDASLPPAGSESRQGAEPASIEREVAVVERVIDGDTIVLASGERVRLIGIDTPERGECYFEEARAYLAWWLDRAEVVLESDGRDKDDYGRLLRYVFTNRQWGGPASTTEFFVNDRMVEEGFARRLPIGDAKRYRGAFAASEEAARSAGVGRWSECS